MDIECYKRRLNLITDDVIFYCVCVVKLNKSLAVLFHTSFKVVAIIVETKFNTNKCLTNNDAIFNVRFFESL